VVDFDKLLQESLLGVNKAFEQADADLHELVAAASEALGRVSNGGVEMTLRKLSESSNGVLYELRLEQSPGHSTGSVVVGAYQVSTKGYPVRSGEMETVTGYRSERQVFSPKLDFADKATLQRHFEELMSSPDSPVIVNAAFFMRTAGST
jgi:hypothetical protein